MQWLLYSINSFIK